MASTALLVSTCRHVVHFHCKVWFTIKTSLLMSLKHWQEKSCTFGFACAGQAPYTCLSEIDDRGSSLHVSYLVHESCWLSTKNVRYKDQHQVGMGRTQKSVSSLPNTGSSTQLKLLVSYVPRARVMQGMTSWQVINFYHQIIKRSSPADKSLPASLVPQPWHVRDKELQLCALC